MMKDLSKFHVCVMISNPVGYKSRYELFKKFRAEIEAAGLSLWVCEIAQGEIPFQISRGIDPQVIQLRTETEIWHKERALNLLVQELPWDWEYVAILDGDISFVNNSGPDAWYYKTLQALQTYHVVQLFSTAIDLGPEGEALKTHNGFVYSYMTNRKTSPNYQDWHPGFAWAYSRYAWDALGGMYDTAILGSGDRHTAYALINKVSQSVDKDISGTYLRSLKAYEERAERFVRRDIGFIPGTITHNWHGRKKNRAYDTRWKILTECAFDPTRDIKPDYQGLWQWQDHGDENSINLRDRVRAYFRQRQEDGIEND